MIDVEAWSKKYHEAVRGRHDTGYTKAKIVFAADLIRAVIAEQTPQIADAVLKCRVDADAGKAAEAHGEVPEWLVNAIYEATTVDIGRFQAAAIARRAWGHGKIREQFEQATAEKGKEHKEHLAKKDRVAEDLRTTIFIKNKQIRALEVNLRDRNRELKATAEKDKRIAELESQLAERDEEVSGLKKECERLTTERTKICKSMAGEGASVFFDLAPYVDSVVQEVVNLREAVADVGKVFGCEDHAEPQQYARCAEEVLAARDAELTKLRQQLADATKPVGDVDWSKIYSRVQYEVRFGFAGLSMQKCVEPLLQRERAARVDAERKLAELREFVRTRYTDWGGGDFGFWRAVKRTFVLPDSELDKMLDAFLAEKGKVQA